MLADLDYADMRWTDLRNARLSGADLTGADLQGADISGVYFGEQKLAGRGPPIPPANLTGAVNLTQEQIDSADGSAGTPIPPDLTLPSHWSSD